MATPDPTPVPLSGDRRIDGLLEPSNWVSNGESLVLTWSPHDFGNGHWTEYELKSVQAAFNTWSAVANITFVRVDDPHNFRATAADIAVVATGTRLGEREDAAGLALTPDPDYTNFNLLGTTYNASNYPRSQGDMFIDDAANNSFLPGGFGFLVLVHEIGHALGLKHPHDPPAGRTFDALGIGARDNNLWTVMSYNHPQGEFVSPYGDWPVTPMPLDILAIQYVYGANMTWRTGADVYEFSRSGGFETIWDAGGEDTISGAGFAPVVIRLTPGSLSSMGGEDQLAIAYNVTIENADGGSYADRIFGNTADNDLDGKGGNDVLSGAGGNDLLTGAAGHDWILGHSGVDVLQGGSGNDDLVGGAGNDELQGGAGHDVLLGGGGGDTLFGGGWADELRGGKGADRLDGGSGSDRLYGGAGNDTLVWDEADAEISGGGGVDTLVVADGNATVTVATVKNVMSSIEVIDLTGDGTGTLRITPAQLLKVAGDGSPFVDDGTRQILVRGDTLDRVISVGRGWEQDASIVIDGVEVLVYRAGEATLLVEADVDVFLDYEPVVEIGVLDLNGLDGFRFLGLGQSDRVGAGVAVIGDFNGDGFDDLLVGTEMLSVSEGRNGAFVVFGTGHSNEPELSRGSLTGANGFGIYGVPDTSIIAGSVQGAGDVNGDGLADLVVSTLHQETYSVTVNILYGSIEPFPASIETSSMSGTGGFQITGDSDVFSNGASVAGAGDVNGDGIDDLLVAGAVRQPDGELISTAFVIYGGVPGPDGTLVLSAVDGSNGFVIAGGPETFSSVRAAGDINGDGFADVILGSRGFSGDAFATGGGVVVLGGAGLPARVDVSTLDGSNGFVFFGNAERDYAGESVSAAGDINGDGFDDFIVGAANALGTGAGRGVVYVVFGSDGGFPATLQLSDLQGAAGFIIYGGAGADFAGISVDRAGDVNADGFDDILIGTRDHDSGSWSAYVVFGHGGEFESMHLPEINGSNGFRILGDGGIGYRGIHVAGGGDLNGDGFYDVVLGAPRANLGGVETGAAHVVFGRDTTLSVSQSGTIGDDVLVGGDQDERLLGRRGDDVITGGAGDDVITGGAGDDELSDPDSGNDFLRGGTGDDDLAGGAGVDLLRGGAGADTLNGGDGIDMLRGGIGHDVFVFNSTPGAEGADWIMDFAGAGALAIDLIQLDSSVFATLAAGNLGAGKFVSGADPMAADADDFILYDTTTGALYYDTDGSGAGAALQFALLVTAPATLDATDFIVT